MTVSPRERSTLKDAFLGATIEVLQTHNGVYRAADTALIFIESPALVTTKHIIKAFQIIPDTLENIQEYLKKGHLDYPFAATAIFLRNVVVEIEVASCLGLVNHLSTDDSDEDHRFISDLASGMHIVVMGFVAYRAINQLRFYRNLPSTPLNHPKAIQAGREAKLAIATATTKIAQQSFALLHTPYYNIVKLLSLIFNVCAVVSCLFSTNSVRRHYSH